MRASGYMCMPASDVTPVRGTLALVVDRTGKPPKYSGVFPFPEGFLSTQGAFRHTRHSATVI